MFPHALVDHWSSITSKAGSGGDELAWLDGVGGRCKLTAISHGAGGTSRSVRLTHIAGGGLPGGGQRGPGGDGGQRGGPGGNRGPNGGFNQQNTGPTMTFRAQFQNLLNHVQYGNYIGTLTSPFFGRAISTSRPPRQVELGLRLNF